ncbi:hypothetical protein [uncultured Arcticibacterium sp.]|uniref:hypothetical protein n=1 Tax=uncultured Arcticibacterium sp. TaxID=2173042 RepID=UPI0030F7C0C9
MVKSNDTELLLKLCNEPEKATPLDFEKLAELLDRFPDFDLLRKAFILVGEQFGASGENFEKERAIWNGKRIFYEPESVKVKTIRQEEIDNYSLEEKIKLFLKHYKAVNAPS